MDIWCVTVPHRWPRIALGPAPAVALYRPAAADATHRAGGYGPDDGHADLPNHAHGIDDPTYRDEVVVAGYRDIVRA